LFGGAHLYSCIAILPVAMIRVSQHFSQPHNSIAIFVVNFSSFDNVEW